MDATSCGNTSATIARSAPKALDSQYCHENDSFSSVEASVVVTCWESERKRRSPTIGQLKQSRLAGHLESFPNYQEELAFAFQSAATLIKTSE